MIISVKLSIKYEYGKPYHTIIKMYNHTLAGYAILLAVLALQVSTLTIQGE